VLHYRCHGSVRKEKREPVAGEKKTIYSPNRSNAPIQCQHKTWTTNKEHKRALNKTSPDTQDRTQHTQRREGAVLGVGARPALFHWPEGAKAVVAVTVGSRLTTEWNVVVDISVPAVTDRATRHLHNLVVF